MRLACICVLAVASVFAGLVACGSDSRSDTYAATYEQVVAEYQSDLAAWVTQLEEDNADVVEATKRRIKREKTFRVDPIPRIAEAEDVAELARIASTTVTRLRGLDPPESLEGTQDVYLSALQTQVRRTERIASGLEDGRDPSPALLSAAPRTAPFEGRTRAVEDAGLPTVEVPIFFTSVLQSLPAIYSVGLLDFRPGEPRNLMIWVSVPRA